MLNVNESVAEPSIISEVPKKESRGEEKDERRGEILFMLAE